MHTTQLDRRSFLERMGLSTIGCCGLSSLAADAPAPASQAKFAPKNWIWTGVDAHQKPEEQQRRFANLRAEGIHAVLFSGSDPAVFQRAKAEGLETHLWMWTLCRGDKDLLERHPDWYGVSRDGKSTADKPPYVDYYHFLCPYREGVREHLAQQVAALAETPNLDGIHLDYIRYPDVILPIALWEKYHLVQNEELPPFDFCYCDHCRRLFRAKTAVDPKDLANPAADEAWRQFRFDGVTELVNQLVEVVHRHHKQITAAVFPSPTIARKLVRQDWVRWNLDAVLPMVYHSFYREQIPWIEATVREGVDRLPPDRPLYAGLYLPDLRTEAEFDEAVRRAMAGGARGVSLFGGLRKVKN